MKKIMGLGAMLLAGLLIIPGNLGLASPVLAQSDAQTIEDKKQQELRQRRQEVWQEREREGKQLENTGQRQKAAEQRGRELEEEEK